MASKYVVLAVFAVIALPAAMATEYIVGDTDGWKVGPNYTQWASGKVFYVGDTLVFQYQQPHNVYKVDGNGFKDCKADGNVLNSGNDTITLGQPGKKWYICGYSDHCSQGQKLVINVLSNGPTAEPPSNDSYTLFSIYDIVLPAILLMGLIALY